MCVIGILIIHTHTHTHTHIGVGSSGTRREMGGGAVAHN